MAENKGKLRGRKARAKADAGRTSPSRERDGQAGSLGNGNDTEEHPAGHGGPEQQAGGPEHHGGDAHEDRNP